MEHNYTQLAEELRKRVESSISTPAVEVSEHDGEQDGIWISDAEFKSIHRFMEVADFCRYHDLNVYVTERIIFEPKCKTIPAIRIF